MTIATLPEWWSIRSFSEALDLRQTSVNRIAKREGWENMLRHDGLPLCASRSVIFGGKGGGKVYRIDVLTPAQQEQLRLQYATSQAAEQTVVVAKAPTNIQERLDEFSKLSPKKKAEARRKLIALNLFEQYRRSMTVRNAIAKVSTEIGQSATTIQNWRNLVKPVITEPQYWEAYLAPRHRGKKGFCAECHPEAFEYYKSSYLTLTKRSYQACYHFTKKVADDLGWQLASPAAMSARLKREVPYCCESVAA